MQYLILRPRYVATFRRKPNLSCLSSLYYIVVVTVIARAIDQRIHFSATRRVSVWFSNV